VIFLIGVNGLAWQNMHAQTVSEQLHTHTRVVIKQWGDVFSSLKDAETGQRGFLITGKPAYLEPYRVSLDACLMHLTDLRRLSADHPAQHQRLAALALLVAARLSELKERIALRETHGLTGARQPIMTQSGNDLMNRIGALEAQAAIQEYEAAAKQVREKAPDSLEALKTRVLAASTNGVLQAHIRTIVEENRQQAVQPAAA
jgi:CHASE3 domain sensor protein